MNQIPTAEDFLDNQVDPRCKPDCIDFMVAFAKLHVQAALQAAVANAEIIWDGLPEIGEFQIIDKASILNAYDLNQIK